MARMIGQEIKKLFDFFIDVTRGEKENTFSINLSGKEYLQMKIFKHLSWEMVKKKICTYIQHFDIYYNSLCQLFHDIYC
jgi:hypothetical protein